MEAQIGKLFVSVCVPLEMASVQKKGLLVSTAVKSFDKGPNESYGELFERAKAWASENQDKG